MMPNLTSPHQQRGATLIIALVFLVILTLLGTTVASNNVLQERMAGNTRNRDLAFQAAEHALEDAQAKLNAYADGTATNLPGSVTYNAATPNTTAQWLSTWPSGAQSVSGMSGLCSNPEYVIEQLPNDATGNEYYRVTARGVGGGSGANAAACITNGSAVVILQTMYRRGVS